ncbi:tRNA (cytidine(34)-2'-O)-methyltransferase [Propionibacteriaceae bacterium Y1685]|uniref:tRNA (cytidine(34)-2'-O)-methyltransferase n=1 Tax=Microlunatus sp. Y1700 TaxID=3418487 RepID=UPI003D3E618D
MLINDEPLVHLVYWEPRIPQNTGAAIRLAAVSGAHLHLVEPLGFELDDTRLRRAGLDYHDLALVTVHADHDQLWQTLGERRVFAFTAHAQRWHTDVTYQHGDVLLFGPEPTGLSPEVLADSHVHDQLRIPMIPGRRSLNLSNATAVATYEVGRQLGFPGAN